MLGRLTDDFDAEDLAWYQEQDSEVADLVRQIQHHEDEIARFLNIHEQKILKLRNRLNGRLPMGFLPDDVLVKIFHRIITEKHQSYWDWHQKDDCRAWRPTIRKRPSCPDDIRSSSIILVCRRWRDLILEHPQLWTSITSFDHPDYANLAIARSMCADLSLRLVTPQQKVNAGCFNRLVREISRATYFEYSSIPFPTYFWRDVGAELPSPESLVSVRLRTIRYNRLRYGVDQYVHHDPFMKVLGGASIQALDTVILVWPSQKDCRVLARPTITYLDISTPGHGEREFQLDPKFLLDFLLELPLLEILRLHCPTIYDSGEGSLAHVTLNHLQELDVHLGGPVCVRFLSQISFPPRTAVSIEVDVAEGSDTGGEELAERLKLLCFEDLPPPCRLEVGVEGHRYSSGASLIVRLSSDSSPFHMSKYPTLLISPGKSGSENLLHDLDSMLSCLPIGEVNAMDFPGDSVHCTGGLTSIFSLPISGTHHVSYRWTTLVKSTTIIIRGLEINTHPVFFGTGYTTPRDTVVTQEDRSHLQFPSPNMKRLELYDVKSTLFPPTVDHLLGVLCDIVENRASLGIPLSEIIWIQGKKPRIFISPEGVENMRAKLIQLGVVPTIDVPLSDDEENAEE